MALIIPRKLLIINVILLSAVFRSSGQDARTLAWSYTPYPDVETNVTKAPAGYKPVYISTFSRHGSRYLLAEDRYTTVLRVLESAERAGCWTEVGQSVLEDVRKISADASGRLGTLLPRGGREHYNIMRRTTRRYPEIFSGNDCLIDVYASLVPRCLVSMSYSLDAVTAANPKVRYVRHSDDNVQAEVFNSYPVSVSVRDYIPYYDSDALKNGPGDSVFGKLFTYTLDQRSRFISEADRKVFVRYIWELAMESVLNEELGLDLYKYFSYDDFWDLWKAINRREYFTLGPSEEFGEIVRSMAAPILAHIVRHSDEALATGKFNATLRYGHDTQIVPLVVLMGIEPFCSPVSDTGHPEKEWNIDKICTMAANIQMVFFRKRGSDDILVKVLHNENEVRISGVTTDKWPFYHWADLRAHYLDALEKNPSFNKGGWQNDTIQDGLVYRRYSGKEAVSGVNQIVSVVDVDLNNPRYKVKFSFDENNITTSDAFKKAGAVASVNATYERVSSFIKVDGVVHNNIDSDVVPVLGAVPQWKTDCSISANGREVRIEYTGKDLDLRQRREAFASIDYPDVFGCSPMLIDNHIPVGKYFAATSLSQDEILKLNYEDKYRHQAVRHPRTAVALTDDNHLILVAVDGRRPSIAEGMNAFELTSFIEAHFHPAQAMNLDGGGSTTLCVKNRGNKETNVVNYPSGSHSFMHDGERKVVTHIHILDSLMAE